jgi:hypothetical protein
VFQVLTDLDGVDVVLGLNLLRAHGIDVLSSSLSVSIPSSSAQIVVNAASQQPSFSKFSSAALEVVSGARLARLLAHEECAVFIAYIKALHPCANQLETAACTPPPPDYAPFEQALSHQFADVLREEVPPGLPPESYLVDGRPVQHDILLKPDATPVSQQRYKLSPAELDEVQKTILRLSKANWMRPSLSPWGSPVLFQRKKSGKLRMCFDYRALNHETVKCAYPMPRIEELLEKRRGSKVVRKLDLSEGFHQI